MTDDPRARRVADNEAAFRLVNERVEELANEHDIDPEFVCECAQVECTGRLRVPVEEYERVRSHGRHFVVAAGHEQPAFERIIDQGLGWIVVEKEGEVGEVRRRPTRAATVEPRAHTSSA